MKRVGFKLLINNHEVGLAYVLGVCSFSVALGFYPQKSTDSQSKIGKNLPVKARAIERLLDREYIRLYMYACMYLCIVRCRSPTAKFRFVI